MTPLVSNSTLQSAVNGTALVASPVTVLSGTSLYSRSTPFVNASGNLGTLTITVVALLATNSDGTLSEGGGREWERAALVAHTF